jgi:hypothetical protein
MHTYGLKKNTVIKKNEIKYNHNLEDYHKTTNNKKNEYNQ